jgi:hypothetical protein
MCAPGIALDHLETEIIFEHRFVQIGGSSEPGWHIEQKNLWLTGGNFVFAFARTKNMESIELYSITPDRGKVKIYTLNLKQ